MIWCVRQSLIGRNRSGTFEMSFPRSSLRGRRSETARFQLISKRSRLVDSDGKQERPWKRGLDFRVEHLKREERGGKRISRMLSFRHVVHKNQFTRHLAALKFNSPILSTLSRTFEFDTFLPSVIVHILKLGESPENIFKVRRKITSTQRSSRTGQEPLTTRCSLLDHVRSERQLPH